VNGRFDVTELPHGTYDCRIIYRPPGGEVVQDAGVLVFRGQSHHDIDASSLRWTEVALRLEGSPRQHDSFSFTSLDNDTWVPAPLTDGFPDPVWLPQGRYLASWVSTSDLTGDRSVSQVPLEIAAGQNQLVVALHAASTSTTIVCVGDGARLLNDWVFIRHYGFRRTDDAGLLDLDGYIAAGEFIRRATFDEHTRSLTAADSSARLTRVPKQGAHHLKADFR